MLMCDDFVWYIVYGIVPSSDYRLQITLELEPNEEEDTLSDRRQPTIFELAILF